MLLWWTFRPPCEFRVDQMFDTLRGIHAAIEKPTQVTFFSPSSNPCNLCNLWFKIFLSPVLLEANRRPPTEN
jgi:hypothetical protein